MKFLNVKPLCMIYILRFCSLLVYLALIYQAIKITPCKKWLFLFLALLPINVYQASSINTDGITLGFIFLFIAYTLKLAFDEKIKKIENKEIIIWDLLIICIGILKFTYLPLILFYFLIPKTKFKTENLYYKNFAVIVLFNIFIIAFFLFGVMSTKGLTEYAYENKLLSSFEMMKKIASAPFDYIILTIKSTFFLKEFFYYNVISSIGGNLVMIPHFASHLTWFLIFLSAFYKNKAECVIDLTLKNKAIILAILILSHFLIMTSIYLIYQTKPYIVGVQGRYLTPLLPMLLFLFNSKKIFLQNKIIAGVLSVMSQFLLFMTFIIIMVYYY